MNDEQYSLALKLASTMMDAKHDTLEEMALDALIDWIVEYENEHFPIVVKEEEKGLWIMEEGKKATLLVDDERGTEITLHYGMNGETYG